MPANSGSGLDSFLARLLVVLVAVALLLFVWYVLRVFLLVFAGVVLAMALGGLTLFLGPLTNLPRLWNLLLVVTSLVTLIVLGVWYMGPRLARQFDQILTNIPNSYSRIRATFQNFEWGRLLIRKTPGTKELLTNSFDVVGQITGVFSGALNVILNLFIVLFIGIYLTVHPRLYINGILQLVPPARESRFREVLNTIGHALRWWILGRSISMLVIGALTGIGLWFLGVPTALALGIIAGILALVPYLGPVLSAIPALMLALLEGPYTVLYVFFLYVLIQTIESYFLSPMVQKRAIRIPPALLIVSQIVMGVVAGIMGVIVATPLLVAVVVVVQMLYVEDVLGRSVKLLGEGKTA